MRDPEPDAEPPLREYMFTVHHGQVFTIYSRLFADALAQFAEILDAITGGYQPTGGSVPDVWHVTSRPVGGARVG